MTCVHQWYPPVFLSNRQLKESELWAELRRVAKSWGLSPWQPICSATGRPTTRGFTLQMTRFYDLLLVVENHRQIIKNHRANAGYSKYSEILATKAAPVFLKLRFANRRISTLRRIAFIINYKLYLSSWFCCQGFSDSKEDEYQCGYYINRRYPLWNGKILRT